MYSYEKHVLPFKNQYTKIVVPANKVKRIKEFVTELIKEKEKESHHLIDNRSHFKRYYTGTLGEAALEEYLGIDTIIDWTIGNSNDFHKPDLRNIGVNAGIKTVEYGLFPLIFKKSYSPEVIMIKVSDNHIVLCGLAMKDILDKYQSVDLIKDDNLRRRGSKTGFYGFEHLKTFATVAELQVMAPSRG